MACSLIREVVNKFKNTLEFLGIWKEICDLVLYNTEK